MFTVAEGKEVIFSHSKFKIQLCNRARMTHLQLKEGEYTATIYGMVCQLHKVSQIILQFDLINLANVVMTVDLLSLMS